MGDPAGRWRGETGFIVKDEKGEIVGSGREGALGYLKWNALHRPERFLGLMARVAPKHVIAQVTHGIMTQDETEAELRDLGLPVELLEHLRIAPVELDFDEDDDPYGLTLDVTPDGTENKKPDGTENKSHRLLIEAAPKVRATRGASPRLDKDQG